jgi:hypothetical protein
MQLDFIIMSPSIPEYDGQAEALIDSYNSQSTSEEAGGIGVFRIIPITQPIQGHIIQGPSWVGSVGRTNH